MDVCKIPLTPQLGLHLNGWLQDQNILKGYCFQPRPYLVTLTKDASLGGGALTSMVI